MTTFFYRTLAILFLSTSSSFSSLFSMDSITSRYYQCGYLYYKTKVPLQSSQLTLVHSDAFIQFIHSLSSLSLSELLVDVNIEFYLFYFQVIVQYQQSSGEILIDENSTKCFYNHYLHIYDVLDTSSLSSIIHYLYCLIYHQVIIDLFFLEL